MKRTVYLGIGDGGLWLSMVGEPIPKGATALAPKDAKFWLKQSVPPMAHPNILHALGDIAEAVGYTFHGAMAAADEPFVMQALGDAIDQKRLLAYRNANKEGGGKGPAPQPQPGPKPQPPPPPPVSPIIEPAWLVVVVPKKAKNPKSGAEEPYTHPKRQKLTLKTDAAFDGTATFTCDKADKVKFFSAEKAGTEIKFDGTANVFKPKSAPAWAPKGATISSGVSVWVEGVKPSDKKDDITVKLSLSGGSKPTGPDDSHKITSVEVTLDIHKSSPDAATAPALSKDDKVFVGRDLLVQNAGGLLHRAKLVIAQVKPSDFEGQLELKAKNGHVDAFKDLKAKAKKDNEPSALPFTIAANKIKAAGEVLYAQGMTASKDLVDTGFTLGIKGIEDVADLVAATAIQIQLDVCKRRKKPKVDPEALSETDKLDKGIFVHEQDAKKTFERAMVVVRAVKPAKFKGKLTLAADPAGKVEVFADEDPASAGAATALPHDFDYAAEKNEDKKLWVQGKAVSAKLREVSLLLHLKDDPAASSDKAAVTVVKMELEAKVPTTASARGAFAVAVPNPPGTHHKFKSTLGTKKFADNAPITLVRNTADIDLEVKTTPANVPVVWSVEDNPGPDKKRPNVAKKVKDTEATLTTDAAGGYSVIASAEGGSARTLWNIVLVGFSFKSSKVTVGKGSTIVDQSQAGQVNVSTGAFNVNNPAVCGMHTTLKGTFEAGGDASLDPYINKVHGGIVNVLQLTDARCNYPGGRRERERILSPRPASFIVVNPAVAGVDIGYPILDRGDGARATGGNTIYLSSTREVPANGKKRTIETCDSPSVIFTTPHPIAGGNATDVAGTNQFAIYLVLYSDDANYAYVAFGSGNWTANYTGPVAFPPMLGGVPQWSKGAGAGVTGSKRLTAIKDGQPADRAGCEVRTPEYLTYIVDAR